MANVFQPDWDEEQDRQPFSWKRARLGRQAGGRALGASLFELPPGSSSFPLHIHHANEELLIVLSGRPTLRTLDGERELAEGELVACPTGRSGAHRIDNRSDAPVRLLVISTMLARKSTSTRIAGRCGHAPGLPDSRNPRTQWTCSSAPTTNPSTISTARAERRSDAVAAGYCSASSTVVRAAQPHWITVRRYSGQLSTSTQLGMTPLTIEMSRRPLPTQPGQSIHRHTSPSRTSW
jgi:uncharacterized cupin superfamily protein